MGTVRVVSGRKLPIFALDCEARPGPWGGGDFTWRHMLSIAGGPDEEHIEYLGPGFKPKALARFIAPLRRGCLVVTHNGPRYDLPLLNGTMMKMGLEPLPRLLVSDTYANLRKRGHAFSASLGNMAQRFNVEHQKEHFSEYDWELAYTGNRDALDRLRVYNVGDVLTTLALRRRLIELGLLRSPRVWSP